MLAGSLSRLPWKCALRTGKSRGLAVSRADARASEATDGARDQAGRWGWLDRARAIGMVLVVIGHAVVGLLNAGAAAPGQQLLVDLIYSFHMPLFFLMSGFVSAGLMRAAPLAFAQRVGLRTIYPYLLWSVVFLLVHGALEGMTNTQSSLAEIGRLHIHAVSVYWFLYSLALCQIAGRLLWGLGDRAVMAIAAALVIAGLWLGYETKLIGSQNGYQTLHMIGFYLLGQRIGAARMDRWLDPGFAQHGLLLAGAAALSAISIYGALTTTTYATFWSLPASFGASFLAMALARRLGDGPIGAVLASLGLAAMAIFVTHVMLTAGTRIGLDRLLDWREPWSVALAGTALGLAAPWCAHLIARRLKLSVVLGWR